MEALVQQTLEEDFQARNNLVGLAASLCVLFADAPSSLAAMLAGSSLARGALELSACSDNCGPLAMAANALQPAADLAALMRQYYALSAVAAERQLAVAQATAGRSCAYLRCANRGGEGGPAAGRAWAACAAAAAALCVFVIMLVVMLTCLLGLGLGVLLGSVLLHNQWLPGAHPRRRHRSPDRGADQVPPKYRANMRRRRDLNPTWQVRVWSDADLKAAAAALGVAGAYNAATIMNQKIDLGRYCVLYVHGGITVDMDTWALQPLDSLPNLHSLDRLAVSLTATNSLESAVLRKGCFRFPTSSQLCSFVNNAFLLAPPQDLVLLHIIQHCSRKLLDPPSAAWGKELHVNGTTGPDQLNQVISQLPAGMVTILPHTYFEPCAGYDPFCVLPPQAVMTHEHEGTWISSSFRAASSLWYHVKHHWALLVFATVVLWLLLKRRRPA
ncbi:glycosyltransferase sugar-binding region containing DXD motif family [Chlorella sorokiniana]|uniref:Glycosyltransferase sugar-binding region containing DXD motif family n=1 Tax=Chlorella sorokiniana TaxID=3076 RepID=A0A2P6U2I4_CHLSO|nr:glycosyltransferase sugar-binding region containing DXD motif family [Chlorella sorokiniana]|eukprot:PRW60525.1 glycosyltransferase sugar-binding region containing DXD motif family [Chlorella sorokiniana]